MFLPSSFFIITADYSVVLIYCCCYIFLWLLLLTNQQYWPIFVVYCYLSFLLLVLISRVTINSFDSCVNYLCYCYKFLHQSFSAASFFHFHCSSHPIRHLFVTVWSKIFVVSWKSRLLFIKSKGRNILWVKFVCVVLNVFSIKFDDLSKHFLLVSLRISTNLLLVGLRISQKSKPKSLLCLGILKTSFCWVWENLKS